MSSARCGCTLSMRAGSMVSPRIHLTRTACALARWLVRRAPRRRRACLKARPRSSSPEGRRRPRLSPPRLLADLCRRVLMTRIAHPDRAGMGAGRGARRGRGDCRVPLAGPRARRGAAHPERPRRSQSRSAARAAAALSHRRRHRRRGRALRPRRARRHLRRRRRARRRRGAPRHGEHGSGAPSRRFARAGARRGEHVEGPRVPLQAVDHPGSPPLEPDRRQCAGRRARRRHGDGRAAALTALTAAPRAV